MSNKWATQERNTNCLARAIAAYIFEHGKPTVRQIYGLAGLAWITNRRDGEVSVTYKVKKLGDALNEDFSSKSLDDVANEVSQKIGNQSVRKLVLNDTGFTNFYNAYRNSVEGWVKNNYSDLLQMCQDAMRAKSIDERITLMKKIEKLPKIAKPKDKPSMPPENYLTPLFFMLDRDIKFPIINGREDVKELLKSIGVSDKNLAEQAKYMMKLYGKQGIRDAADIDCLGESIKSFVGKNKHIIHKQKHGKIMPMKDENDIKVIRKAATKRQKQEHNKLTNKLREELVLYTLYEGKEQSCRYDVLVKGYHYRNDEVDLLIEVKSSIEMPHVRLAVGQLYDYRFNLEKENKNQKYKLAVLLPQRPADSVVEFLEWMKIGLLWFSDNKLCTETKWLQSIATYSKGKNKNSS